MVRKVTMIFARGVSSGHDTDLVELSQQVEGSIPQAILIPVKTHKIDDADSISGNNVTVSAILCQSMIFKVIRLFLRTQKVGRPSTSSKGGSRKDNPMGYVMTSC